MSFDYVYVGVECGLFVYLSFNRFGVNTYYLSVALGTLFGSISQ